MAALLFALEAYPDLYFKSFLSSELGRMYQSIPWDELESYFLPYKSSTPLGRKSRFRIRGGLALQFLKHYTGLSDAKLIQRVNTDWHFQMFCSIRLGANEQIKDQDTVGRWRRFFALHMDIDELQDILTDKWQLYMKDTDTLLDDATCYESYIKYPTDVKLLYDCTTYLFNTIQKLFDQLGISVPRTKYKHQQRRQTNYQKLKRKPKKRTRKRQRELLYWLNRGLSLLQDQLNKYRQLHQDIKMIGVYEKIKAIKCIYAQQYQRYHHPEQKINNRIVSLYKPYLRPIVRGKENKKVEFGAKVHISQVDQINFIEHLSFDAFHEGVRMWKSVVKHKKRFGKCTKYGGDRIYANRKNRKFAKERKIHTCFTPVGRRPIKYPKQKQQMREAIGRARATRLEGSFGNEKNHYGLRKIKAKTKLTEIAWIFFGIHTANVVKISKRILAPPSDKTAQAA